MHLKEQYTLKNPAERLASLESWLQKQLGLSLSLQSLAGDASHRRYYRVATEQKSWVIMDAPPALENTGPFCRMATLLQQKGLLVPEVLAQSTDEGFLLLSDLGDSIYDNALTAQSADPLYKQALKALFSLQAIPCPQEKPLRSFDKEEYSIECRYCLEWFLDQYLDCPVSAQEQRWMEEFVDTIVALSQAQPQVLVHRDYHCRNLMVLEPFEDSPGILDFQDALKGPLAYDPVSLLKDCYRKWPRQDTLKWAHFFWQHSPIVQEASLPWEHFLQGFDGIGLQRHVKVLGIFARLALRDGKKDYLTNIPRILSYVQEVIEGEPLFAFWRAYWEKKIIPKALERLCVP
jgi:N-acetylmuramate 1-kinase